VLAVGAVHYGRNGHHVASLMHVDHTLPMWAFFDVYGSVQKIKLLGMIHNRANVRSCFTGPFVSKSCRVLHLLLKLHFL